MICEANYLAHGCYFPLPYKAGEQSHTLRASCKPNRFRSAVDTNSTQNRREKIRAILRFHQSTHIATAAKQAANQISNVHSIAI